VKTISFYHIDLGPSWSRELELGMSVEADGCCFCGKALGNVTGETEKQRLTVETTEGQAVVLQYHEACFQGWLGNREHVAPASPLRQAPLIRW
jgi:hypothetical protein